MAKRQKKRPPRLDAGDSVHGMEPAFTDSGQIEDTTPQDEAAIQPSLVLSAGILTVPGREAYLDTLAGQLGATTIVRYQVRVYSDDAWQGVLWNARRAWTDVPAGTTHRAVFESDIVVCRDLLPAIERMVAARPEALISLYGNSYRALAYYQAQKRWRPYIYPSGQGVVLPVAWIDPFWAWVDGLAADHPAKQAAALVKRPGDYAADVLLYHWVRATRRDVWVTVPGLVWHVGWGDSAAFDRPAASGGWLSPKPYTFLGTEASALEIDWSQTP